MATKKTVAKRKATKKVTKKKKPEVTLTTAQSGNIQKGLSAIAQGMESTQQGVKSIIVVANSKKVGTLNEAISLCCVAVSGWPKREDGSIVPIGSISAEIKKGNVKKAFTESVNFKLINRFKVELNKKYEFRGGKIELGKTNDKKKKTTKKKKPTVTEIHSYLNDLVSNAYTKEALLKELQKMVDQLA